MSKENIYFYLNMALILLALTISLASMRVDKVYFFACATASIISFCIFNIGLLNRLSSCQCKKEQPKEHQ